MSDYPKKYWWVVLVIVPLVIAVFKVIPYFVKKDVKQTGNFYISDTKISGDMNFITFSSIAREYEMVLGKPLKDESLKEKIEKAINLVKAGDYKESIQLFEDAAGKIPLPAIYNNLGVLYASTDNYDGAQKAYKKAIKLNPDYETAHLNIGLLKETQGRLKEAESHYKKASGLKEARKKMERIEEKIKKADHTLEVEPNNDIFNSTPIPLSTSVQGNKEESSDQDYFQFKTPTIYRDIVHVQIENLSTTFVPALMVLDANKNDISRWQSAATPGANLEYSFTANPDSTYYVHVTSSGHNTIGHYKLIIAPLKAYDQYEPNDGILTPKFIHFGKSIEAGKMDSKDQDYYHFKVPSISGKVNVFIENRSTTLVPALMVLDANKNDISRWQSAATPGANLEYSFTANPDSTYYVHVTSSGHGTSGKYSLTVKEE